jgi:RNA polymerase sigma-70 factor (ECF subfamily)
MVAAVDEAHRFRLLYERHQPDVLAYFLRRLDRDDAVDATADVFVTAWRRIADMPADSEARLWLFGVAHNVLRNHHRSLRRRGRLRAKIATARVDPEPLPETVVVRREQDLEVISILDRLRPQDREVLKLRLWEEASFDEIATVMQCSRHAAEQRYGRALRRLRSVSQPSGHVVMGRTKPDLLTEEHTE